MRPPVKKESAIEAELVRRVEAAGGICHKMMAIGRRGFPDRLVILPGAQVFFVECKRVKGGRFSAPQIWYAEKFGGLGVAIATVRKSADIDRLLQCRRPAALMTPRA
jgi:hypothetical protein